MKSVKPDKTVLIWFDSRCNPNQTVANFGSVPRATWTGLSGWSDVYPLWIWHRNNRNIAVCLWQFFKLGNVGQSVCNRGKSLIFSNLFPQSECYTDKATAPIYPKRAQLSPAHKIWWWQPIVRNMDCHCCIRGNFKITKSNVILWNTLPLNAASMTLW